MRYMNKQIAKAFMLLVLIIGLVATGCSNNTAAPEDEEQIIEREEIELMLDALNYETESEKITIQFSSNLPEGTIVDRIFLMDIDSTAVLEKEDFTIETESSTIVIDQFEKDLFVDEEYTLVLTISVDEEINSHLLTDELLGGSFAVMQEAYVTSELITLSASNQPNAYSLDIQSQNKLALPEEFFEDIKEEEVVIEEEEEEVVEEEVVEETSSTEKEKARSEFQLVTASDIKQNYVTYMGEKIEVKGEVTQVIQNDPYAMSPTSKSFLVNISSPDNYNADNGVWVEMLSNAPTLFEGSKVTIRGTLLDTYTYESVSGTQITVPYILASSIQ